MNCFIEQLETVDFIVSGFLHKPSSWIKSFTLALMTVFALSGVVLTMCFGDDLHFVGLLGVLLNPLNRRTADGPGKRHD